MTNNDKAIALDMTDPTIRARVILVTIISGLTLELGTGMTSSRGRSPLQVLKADFGFKGNKKAGLKFAIEELQKLDPGYVPGARTTKLL